MGNKSLSRTVVAVILVAGVLVPVRSALSPQSADARPKSSCGPNDPVETGLQGDVPRNDRSTGRALFGYACGIDLIGYSSLAGRGGNANMAWAHHCAYVTTGNPVADGGVGIAVVDVSNPAKPRHVRTLVGPGSTDTLETIHAVVTPTRSVLVAGRYELNPMTGPTPMDIYDVSDCTRPRLVTTYVWPESIHNLTITADGNRVFSTLALQVLDITDWEHPKYLGNLESKLATLAQGPEAGIRPDNLVPLGPRPIIGDYYRSHEAWPNEDGTKLYLGGQLPMFETFTILDITDVADPKVISETEGRGHSIRTATIGGIPYVLHSEESVLDATAKGCLPEELNPVAGAAQPWLTNIADETDPIEVSQFRLEINEPENCPAQLLSGVNASVHYHDVDDPDDTTFALLSMWNAGLRIVDVRDPVRPTEVAYFNPGAFPDGRGGTVLDQAWGHVRYIPETGHIWLATATGGFWVLRLQPQVRKALDLPRVANPQRALRIGDVKPWADVESPRVDRTAPAYCTLAVASAPGVTPSGDLADSLSAFVARP